MREWWSTDGRNVDANVRGSRFGPVLVALAADHRAIVPDLRARRPTADIGRRTVPGLTDDNHATAPLVAAVTLDLLDPHGLPPAAAAR